MNSAMLDFPQLLSFDYPMATELPMETVETALRRDLAFQRIHQPEVLDLDDLAEAIRMLLGNSNGSQ
jgi:hypothetical protein